MKEECALLVSNAPRGSLHLKVNAFSTSTTPFERKKERQEERKQESRSGLAEQGRVGGWVGGWSS